MDNQNHAIQKRLREDVEFLALIDPPRNYKNPESLNNVATYIHESFQDTGLKTTFQYWQANGNFYYNVIASYQPEKSRRLVIGAHYDVYGDFPGADDNASGVAGLLETARMISNLKPNIDYRIDFVAYALEEPPFFGRKEMGSYIHAQSLFKQKIDVIGMVCLEMIGHYAESEDSKRHFPPEIETDFPQNPRDFVGVISIKRFAAFNRRFFKWMKEENPQRAGLVIFPNDAHGPSLSDNRNYWRFGYPALMLNSAPSGKNLNYHQITDTPDTLNYEVMAEVVAAIGGACLRF